MDSRRLGCGDADGTQPHGPLRRIVGDGCRVGCANIRDHARIDDDSKQGKAGDRLTGRNSGDEQ